LPEDERRVLIGRVAALLWLIAGIAIAVAHAQPPRPGPPRPIPPDMRQRMPTTTTQEQSPGRAAAPWIDVHLHLIGGRGPQADYAGAADAAIREMDRFGIATAIVLPPPQVESQQTYDVSAFVGALQRHRGRFAYLGGGGALNPAIHRHADPAQVTDAVKRDFAAAAEQIIEGGAVGFGEMASLHISAAPGHPYEFVPADHPLFLVLADVATRRDVPIDLHMDAVDGEMPTPPRFATQANPAKLADTLGGLARLLAHNPKARIVWAHGGSDPLGGMTPATIGRLIDAHPNLFVSLRIVGPQAPMLNKALTTGGIDPEWKALLTRHADRFMIGTDSFMVSPSIRGGGPGVTFAERNTPKLQATVQFLSLLPPDVAGKIGRENAIRVYKLPAR
jgi:hypothetical protein